MRRIAAIVPMIKNGSATSVCDCNEIATVYTISIVIITSSTLLRISIAWWAILFSRSASTIAVVLVHNSNTASTTSTRPIMISTTLSAWLSAFAAVSGQGRLGDTISGERDPI